MHILLTGSRGFIGRHLMAALTAAGHSVTPISRSCGVDFCRMQSADAWMPLLQGVDAVINSVGIIGERGSQRFEALHTTAPSALFRACSRAGVRRVLQVSALGADGSAFSAYHLSKRAADDCLRGLDLDWFVLRPSLVYGQGGASATMFRRLAALPLIPVVGDGQQKLQPVHIRDVVATVLRCLTSAQTRLTLDIVGNDVTTFSEWLQLMRQSQGRPRARILRTPLFMVMAGAYLGRYVNPMLQPDNIRMLLQGSCADVAPLERFLGRKPLGVHASEFFATTAQSIRNVLP